MDERSGTIRLVDSRDSEARGLVTTISRSEVEKALHADEGVDLLLDVERAAAEGDGRESERIAPAWEPEDLERLLAASSADEITLTFDEAELQRLLDEDVDAHGMREKFAAITVVAGLAAAGAGSAAAMYPATEGGGSAVGTPAAVVAPASEISTGLSGAPAAAPASEISAGLGDASAPAEANLASASEISTGLGPAASDEASLASASEISTGLGPGAADEASLATASEMSTGLGPAASDEASLASASEISTGLGDQGAPAEASLAKASEMSSGLVGETPAAPAEIASGVVQEPPASPAEVTAGIVQQPTAEPVSASPGDSTWSPSPAEAGAIAGTILALTAAGFALRTQRRGGPAVS